MRRALRRLGLLLRKGAEERALDDEIRYHLEMEARELERAGVEPREARRQARLAFGGVERFKEEVRDARGARLVDDFAQDLRLALRTLPARPAFFVTVLATLGIGIGGNVAMFGILESTLFRALPYPEPDRLVLGRVTYDGEMGTAVSGPDYFDTRDQVASLSQLAALTGFPLEVTLTGRDRPERVRSPLVSTNFFTTLGVEAVEGRGFVDAEGEEGAPAVAVLSYGFWQRRFAGDPRVVGSSLRLDGAEHVVVGVMPAGFRFLVDSDVWRPITKNGPFAQARQFHNFLMVGRLADDADLGTAQSEIQGISQRLAELYPESNEGKGMALTPLRAALSEDQRTPLLLLSGAAVLLLIVACANVAGLMLARGGARRPEIALRSVLGAGRERICRQLLTESTLLATLAGPVGVGLGYWLQRGIVGLLSIDGLEAEQVGLSWSTVAAASGLSLLTLLLFGVFPAMRLAASGVAEDLRQSGRVTDPRPAARTRSALVVGQVALTVVLLVTAGLLLRSLWELRGVDVGFDPQDLLVAELQLPSADYSDLARRGRLFEDLQSRVRVLPGITAVGAVSRLPIRDPGNNVRVALPADWHQDAARGRLAYQRMVLPGYFEALGIPLLAGRDVTSSDDRSTSPVVVLSRALAEELFEDREPLGQTVGVDVGEPEPWVAEVIGVVGDTTPTSLASGIAHTMYFSYFQRSPSSMRMAVRSALPSAAVVEAIRTVLSELDPELPLSTVTTMAEVIDRSLESRTAIMALLGVFAALALLLSAVGLYGVLAYQVSRRLHEIGIRLALGATPGEVAGWTLRNGLRLVSIGLLLGAPAAFLASRWIRGMLFGVAGLDPRTYLVVALFLAAVGAVACSLPARRAAAVDPVDTLQVQ